MPPTTRRAEISIVVGSGNLHKVEEIAAALSDVFDPRGRRLRVEGKQALPAGPEPAESGSTFAENALIKARGYAALAARMLRPTRPLWVLADDSGLSVDALGGAPGVRSARYAGEEATDSDNNEKLLAALGDVPEGLRGAEFVCALSLVLVPESPDSGAEEVLVAEGRARGEILFERAGSGGFGYDPLFYLPSLGKTFAQISTEEKNVLSHRGRALQLLRERLPGVLKGCWQETLKGPRFPT